MGELFERMGFKPIARHRHKNVTLYRQGEHQLHRQRRAGLVRAALRAPARPERLRHRLPRAGRARPPTSARSSLGAWGYAGQRRPGRAEHPGDQGHRRLAHLLRRPLARQERREGRRHRQHRLLRRRLRAAAPAPSCNPRGHGLTYIDHLTHNVHRGRMEEWADFYERLFNFREVRYFDIEGQAHRRQEQGHDQPLRQDPHPDQRGRQREGRPDPGVPGQVPRRGHPAHRAGLDRPATTRSTRCEPSGVKLLDTSDTYYELLDKRIPGHGERRRRTAAAQHPGRRQARARLLLQIFSENQLGPDLLRVHPAQGRRGLRRRQLQGAVREHRARPDAPRRAGRQQGTDGADRRIERVNTGVAPVIYGAGRPPAARRLRARARATTPARRTRPPTPPSDHDTYRRLYERQAAAAAGAGLRRVHRRPARAGRARPHPALRATSTSGCSKATGWEIVAVPGLIPEVAFFALLAKRRFPVTDWIRTPGGVRLHRRARRLPRPVRPCAAAVQPGVRRLHAGLRRGRPEGAAGSTPASCWRGCTGTRSSSA